jgi:hypothetical protein
MCYCRFLVTDPEVPGSIPGATRFSEKWWVWNGVRISEELLEWKSSGSKFRNPSLTAVEIRCADHGTPLYPQKLTKFFLVLYVVRVVVQESRRFILSRTSFNIILPFPCSPKLLDFITPTILEELYN